MEHQFSQDLFKHKCAQPVSRAFQSVSWGLCHLPQSLLHSVPRVIFSTPPVNSLPAALLLVPKSISRSPSSSEARSTPHPNVCKGPKSTRPLLHPLMAPGLPGLSHHLLPQQKPLGRCAGIRYTETEVAWEAPGRPCPPLRRQRRYRLPGGSVQVIAWPRQLTLVNAEFKSIQVKQGLIKVKETLG